MLLGFVPPRTLAPSRKRFGAVRLPANNIRPYTVKTWRPPVPEPLPPAPLLGPKELLGLGALVLVQLFGLLAGRPKQSEANKLPSDLVITGKVPTPGNTTPGTFTYQVQAGLVRQRTCGSTTESQFSYSAGQERVMTGILTVERYEKTGDCGVISQGFKVYRNTGQVFTEAFYSASANTEFLSYGRPVTTTFSGPSVDYSPGVAPIPLPPGYEPSPAPELEPLEEPERAVPLPPRPVVPAVPGLPVVPDSPGVPSTPQPAVPLPVVPAPSTPQIPGSTPIQDGVLVPTQPKPVPVTPPDVVFPVPGADPIGGPGISVRPDIAAVAQEVGRIEQKLERLMSPAPDTLGEKWGLILRAVEALMASASGGTYTLTEPCDPDGDGVFVKREVPYLGAFDQLGVLSNKLDALAELQQAAKDLRQPTCNPPLPKRTGEPVTVTFQSDGVSPVSGSTLRKMFKYFDQTGKSLEDHAAHWKDFTWQAGDVIVSAYGTVLGKPQVWAASEAEGRRVIEHAASIAGVDLTDASWKAVTPANPRFGLPGLMRVKDYGGYLWVTKRPDPSGPPELASP